MKPIQAVALALTVGAGTLLGQAPALAQDAGYALELNDLRSTETGCRLTYVAKNSTGIDVDAASFEVALFDAEGAVNRLLILEFGALRDGRSKVVQFDLADQSCENISRLLVNASAACAMAGNEQADCLDILAPSSRTEVEFGL